MLAANFAASLPEWSQSDDEEESLGSTDAVNESLAELDDMVEIQFEFEENAEVAEESQSAELLKERIMFRDIDRSAIDVDELHDVELDFESSTFTLPQLPDPTEPYAFIETLRSTCTAHALQLVVGDGLKTIDVIIT